MCKMIPLPFRSVLRAKDVLRCFHKNAIFQQECVSLDIPSENSGNGALEIISGDLSEVNPYFSKSFNIAAYVNKSETLQALLHFNVDLSKIEKKPHIVEKLLRLDIEHIQRHLFFLKDNISPEDLGNFITKNPLIFCEPIDYLEVRLNYLQSKLFTTSEIKRIITKNPFWLMFSTTRIDRRLGYFQTNFSLLGKEVRFLAAKQPKLFTYNLHHIKTNTFVIKEEMGFDDKEIKQMILSKPKLWMINQKSLLQRFHYIHNVMQIPHSSILSCPGILLYRNFKIKQRHLFLEKLGRAQYNPQKENYVPIIALSAGTDIEFCNNYAKCNVDDFNTFLKTI